MPSTFWDWFDRMRCGDVPTSRDFRCPACGGAGHAAALLMTQGHHNGQLAVSMWCSDCSGGFEADGIDPWPGWERIATSMNQVVDPRLSFVELKKRLRDKPPGNP